jgi:Spy/CpxP family protein refolding chaperone
MSVSIHDGKIEIDGIEELVQDQLERVGEALDSVPDMPPDVRVRIKDRVKSVRDKLGARLGKLKSMDLDKLGPEMERMGDDLERDMEGLDKDLEQLGINVGKDFAEKFGKDFAKDFARSFAPSRHDRDNSDDGDDDATDHDDDDRPGVTLDDDMVDPSDMRAAIAGLKGMMLGEDQKAQLAKLRRESEQQISDAKRDLETLSNRLHDALGDAGASEADIARQIDQISAKEATIRKARILAWVRVRSLLDKDQRTKVEAAARKHH